MTFSNANFLSIPSAGAGNPYPSFIAVTGVPGVVTNVRVTLRGLGHTYPADLDVLLVGPSGQSALLMSDAGSSLNVTNLTLTFDNAASTSLPSMTRISSGTYRPTNFSGSDTNPPPAPPGPYGTNLSVFNGTHPNGNWSLFVHDDKTAGTGSISNGWSLELSTEVIPVFINEWLALNSSILADKNGDFDPWFELYNAGTNAVDLSGFYLTDDLNNRTNYSILSPVVLGARSHLLIWADGESAEGSLAELHTNFRLAADGGTLALFSPNGGLIDSVTFGPQQMDFSQGRYPDGSGAIHCMAAASPATNNSLCDTNFISITNVWRYHQSGTNLGTAWREPGYDDAGWPNGPALLYNETAPLPAPKNTPLTLGPTTFYFRTRFVNPRPIAADTLIASTVIDDGAVFYLNGAEALRLRMPAGTYTYGTLATAIVDNAVYEGPFSIATSNLTAGTNVIAVEVHQAVVNSTDVVFGLALASSNPPPLTITMPPLSQTVSTGATVTFKVAASGPAPLQYRWRWNGGLLFGQTNSTLVLTNVQPTNGGFYAVVVFGGGQAVASPPASLRVLLATNYLFYDPFGSFTPVTATAGAAETNNLSATREPADEPNHAGKPGSNSMWFVWMSPAGNGIATFSTHGSDFDTLLAAYIGSTVSALTPMAAADDSDGRLTSTIRFGTQPSTLYSIAIDGYYGETGHIVLSWSFAGMPAAGPRIVNTPTNRSVLSGASTTFLVTATNATTYQWYFNGNALTNQTNALLTILGVHPTNVGYYAVRAFNTNFPNAPFVESVPAVLEIGNFPGVVSHDKREDALASPPPPVGLGPAPSERLAEGAGVSASLASVAAGSLYMQILNNTNSTIHTNELRHCDQVVTSTRWFALRATNHGLTCVLDTRGSSNDTMLAIYTGGTRGYSVVTCTNESGAQLRFDPTNGITYSAVVDGRNGKQGIIRLNYGLGTTSQVVLQPLSTNVISGSNVTFSANATGIPPPRLQWQMGGTTDAFVDIPQATQASFTLTATQTTYLRVIASNFVATVPSQPALLTVGLPPTITNGPTNLTVNQGDSASFSVVAGGTLPLSYQWFLNATAIPGATSDHYTRANVSCSDKGFYSVVVSNAYGAVTSAPALLCPVPPAMIIRWLDTNNVELVWSGIGYTLQSTTNLPAPPSGWISNRNASPFQPTNGNRFYRLACPCP